MAFLIIKYLIAFLLLVFLVGVWRTWQMEHSENQKLFLAGTVPNPAPNGLYHGTVPGHKVSWLGKKFDAEAQTGINLFDDGKGGQAEQYPFKTSVTKGLRDKNLDVVAIDYNISGNPFWLRLILDEIVQVGSDKYLGKLHVRIFPGLPFTLGYFELKK